MWPYPIPDEIARRMQDLSIREAAERHLILQAPFSPPAPPAYIGTYHVRVNGQVHVRVNGQVHTLVPVPYLPTTIDPDSVPEIGYLLAQPAPVFQQPRCQETEEQNAAIVALQNDVSRNDTQVHRPAAHHPSTPVTRAARAGPSSRQTVTRCAARPFTTSPRGPRTSSPTLPWRRIWDGTCFLYPWADKPRIEFMGTPDMLRRCGFKVDSYNYRNGAIVGKRGRNSIEFKTGSRIGVLNSARFGGQPSIQNVEKVWLDCSLWRYEDDEEEANTELVVHPADCRHQKSGTLVYLSITI